MDYQKLFNLLAEHGFVATQDEMDEVVRVVMELLFESNTPYRVGKKQSRALLDANGHQVALFAADQSNLALEVCRLLNNR